MNERERNKSVLQIEGKEMSGRGKNGEGKEKPKRTKLNFSKFGKERNDRDSEDNLNQFPN